MTIRSIFLRTAIVFLLVFTQVAATAHTVEHLRVPSQSRTHHEQLPNELPCLQCLAFLSVGSALTGSAVDFPVSLVNHAKLITDTAKGSIPSSTCPFDSRAPPLPLA